MSVSIAVANRRRVKRVFVIDPMRVAPIAAVVARRQPFRPAITRVMDLFSKRRATPRF